MDAYFYCPGLITGNESGTSLINLLKFDRVQHFEKLVAEVQ